MKKRIGKEEESFVDIFWEDIKIILKHQKTILKQFSLVFEHYEYKFEKKEYLTMFCAEIMERFEQNLKNRLRPLQVRTIDYGIINQKEMMTIFPFICTETLEKIVIGNSEGLGQKHLDINKIVKLEQWKKAKKVQFNEFFVSEPIRSFAHFSKVSISMDTVTTEIIKSLKEIFRDSPVMSYFEIYYNPSRYPQDLRSLFGHRFDGSFTDEDAGPRWFFKIPKNEIHVISVQSNLHSWLRLTRFKKEDLPGD
uniref:F-box domain-containing protein n=1 Tax=Caenorhabditis tropicalis TaxID=1561998 RepID=A0A1I7UWJ0_9PELO